MKIFFRRIHLYLSLSAGLVILIACLTGAILVFEKDAQMALNKDRYHVTAGTTHLPAAQLVKNVKDSFVNFKVNSIKIYQDATRSAEIGIAEIPKKDKNKGAKAKGAAPQAASFTIFVNPYTGQILEKYSHRETFFYQVFALHRWLLGGNDSIGKYIVGIATFIFLFILITGIILWFPKTKKILIQRLKIKTGAGFKRLNHDPHIVLGFYSAIFLFIFAFTGLAWSFEWFNNGIYKVTSSPLKTPPPPKSTYIAEAQTISVDDALNAAKGVYKDVQFYSVSLPKDSTDPISVSALRKDPMHESATDAVYIDQFSGQVLGTMPFENRSLGAKVRSSFKPIHTGSIWGTPSKIIAFIVCIFGVTFPITGVIMWLNRIRKKKNRKVVSRTTHLEQVA